MIKLLLSASGLRFSAAARTTSPTGQPVRCGVLIAPLTVALCSALAGCSAMTSIEPTSRVSEVKGMVHGGQQPVIGATIQLIAPGTTGYGSTGTVIVSTTTDGTGSFTLPRPYTCPANSGLVYILATGGNPGAGTNSSLAEAAVLGPCSGLTASTFISISEVTTVAAAYTLAPFASLSPGITNIGTSSTNLLGLNNAAAAAGNLANIASGQANGATSISGLILPTAEINTLADILSSCVNSGVEGVTSTCSSLFTAATPPGGTAPTDTFQAAIDIALNPGNNAAGLFALATPSAPFQPTLTANPGDFAVGIQYVGGNLGLAQPQGIDIDVQGNAWVSLYYCGRGCSGVSGLMEISPSGVISPSSGVYLSTLVNPQMVAINNGGMVEVADQNGVVLEYAPPGATGSGFTSVSSATGAEPTGLAIDNRDGSTWITNFGNNTITHISQTGTFLTASSPLPSGVAPLGIVVDSLADIIAEDSDTFNQGSTGSNSGLTEYLPNGGGTYVGGTIGTGVGTFPSDVSLDHTGNIWTTLANGVGEYQVNGTLISPQGGYPSNPDNTTDSLEIDGLGRAFVSNNSIRSQKQPGSLTVFSNNGTLISTSNSNYGYYGAGAMMVDPYIPHGLALDASGNCWIAGNTPSAVVEMIGIAAPVATPISVQNTPTNRLGVRP